MTLDLARRPEPGEHVPFYAGYVALVPDGDVLATLRAQAGETVSLLRGLPSDRAGHRYAPGKWSLGQVVGHVADAERVFAYRALAFARGDASELPGFDENAYAEASPAVDRPLAEVLGDLAAVRGATLSLFGALPGAAWARRGVANGNPVTVRALAWIIAGHERHHVRVLRERYLG
jgi:hypothetical protein